MKRRKQPAPLAVVCNHEFETLEAMVMVSEEDHFEAKRKHLEDRLKYIAETAILNQLAAELIKHVEITEYSDRKDPFFRIHAARVKILVEKKAGTP